MNLLDLMKSQGLTIIDLAKDLDVSVSQIYKWNREGISINCKHYRNLKRLIPQVTPKEITLTKNGEEDGRVRSGRDKNKFTPVQETNSYQEEDFQSTLFPKIVIRNKTT